MTTKATRDVLDMSIRPVQNFILDGTGVSRIDSTPIGSITPDTGRFTNLNTTDFTVTGVATFTGATVIGLNSYYADIAEYYEADKDYAPGTVVKIGGDKEITATTVDGDWDVFGVISTEPAYVLNVPADPTKGHYLPVALIGRVPCRVIGPVRKGQRLIADRDGVGRASTVLDDFNPMFFARSLVDDNGTDERLVEVAITTVK